MAHPTERLDSADLTIVRRGSAVALRLLGAASIAAAVLVGGSFAYVAGTVGLVVGLGLGALGAAVGALLLRAGAKRSAAASAEERARRELAILALAEKKGGVLRVTDLSRSLGLSAAEAEAMLASMADGSRVTVEITSDGLVEYVFRELEARTGSRVRVDLEAAPDVEAAEVEVELERTRGEAPRRSD